MSQKSKFDFLKKINRNIEIDLQNIETPLSEKLSNEDLENAKNKLKEEQKSVDDVVNNLSEKTLNIGVGPIKNVKNTISRVKELIENNEINQAITLLDRCKIELDNFLSDLKNERNGYIG